MRWGEKMFMRVERGMVFFHLVSFGYCFFEGMRTL
jgi:hypothetical protein